VRRLAAPLVVFLLLCVPARAVGADTGTHLRTRASALANRAAGASQAGDFNGDGFADLAVGIPGDDGADTDAGAVSVIRGGAEGLRPFRNQLWTQDTRGVPGTATPGEALGSALAVGDFDGDGFADLAIGVPRDVVDGIDRAGAVIVLYGSQRGLRTIDSERWTQKRPGVRGQASRDNQFGAALASGDFDGDGFGDLAIGAPQQEVRGRLAAGSVTVVYGTRRGLSALHDQVFTQESSGIGGKAGDLHLFGWSLAAGGMGRGAADDLAVGSPLDSVGNVPQAGSVTVVYGSTSDRLRPGSSQRWTQDNFRVADRAEAGDLFGWSVAGANMGRSPFEDLAVGVPGEDVRLAADAGAVNVLFARRGGLSAKGNQFRTQNSKAIAGRVRANDAFGSAVAAADFGLTRFFDLAVGVPGEDLHNLLDAGGVNVMYGSRAGLVPRGNQLWTRRNPGLVGEPQAGEAFGSALAAAQFGHFPRADLAVGIERHDVGLLRRAGGVAVLYGSPDGLRAGGNQLWTRASPGISGTPHRGDRFGHAVA
jgi:FG-GAP repeat